MKAPLRDYLKRLRADVGGGDTTERSHYGTLQTLLEEHESGVKVIPEPARVPCGAPDFVVKRRERTIGYMEAKDVGANLAEAEKSEQLKRYRGALANLILTDYLEFRWYVDGELRGKAELGYFSDGKIHVSGKSDDVRELLAQFLAQRMKVPAQPEALAKRMAQLSRMVHDLTLEALEAEAQEGPLHGMLELFRRVLIPDLEPALFADMYAQTLAYGLFVARCTKLPDGKKFVRRDVAELIPRSSPLLREVFHSITGVNLDSRIRWLLNDLTELLAQVDRDELVANIRKRSGDPVVHFYESFLKAYDPKLRETRGVYYTPEPVVSYIVRSVDWLLREKLGLKEGLRDRQAIILDPATGTGTFPYLVIQECRRQLVAAGQQGLWPSFAAENLLPRLFGFELLVAPYAIAHIKLNLQLQGLGVKDYPRLGIYLTNSLEQVERQTGSWFGLGGASIAQEAKQARDIKNQKRIMVVTGNPPYSGHSVNASWRWEPRPGGRKPKKVLTWIGRLIDDYKQVDGHPLGERNPKWLQDDYVKFIRFGQWRIDETGEGILAFITNHSYLDNPTFRGMRQSLMASFSEIYLLDLHGSVKKRERTPEGSKDENVFDIQQGVAIGLFVKRAGHEGPARVFHHDLWGLRDEKYEYLAAESAEATEWQEIEPRTPSYLFVPQDTALLEEYKAGWKVTKIFPLNGVGMTTARDKMVIDLEEGPLIQRAMIFRDSTDSNSRLCQQLNIPEKKGWNITKARQLIKKEDNLQHHVKPILYRPFDNRLIFYHDSLVWRTVKKIMLHMLSGNNIGLLWTRPMSPNYEFSITITSNSIDQCAVGNKSAGAGISYLGPLYLYSEEDPKSRTPNLAPDFVADLAARLSLEFTPDGAGDLAATFGPEDVFHYLYAVLHSPTYRSRYADFLKRDFPRVPLTSSRPRFRRLAALGAKLVDYHLLRRDIKPITTFNVTGDCTVAKGHPRFVADDGGERGRVYINPTQYFGGVPAAVWEFHIGGYQVCRKWLWDRRGRALGVDDLNHYQAVVVALDATIRLMAEVDAAIGAWPLE